MKLQPGDNAPDFTLPASDKTMYTLSENRDKNTVILFFPLAFTGTCTTELCSIRDNYNIYSTLEANVIAISVDAFASLAKFKEQENYNFPLLSDFNKEAGGKYGTLYENWILGMKGVSKRSAFVVDKKGVIRYAEILENAGELPNFAAIQETLKTLH
ncbi:MAG: redoxin domain-containing protein [Saprospiraceae bacterium]|nr:redoxin domain-containing protein [Saprospiraceae bacterium]MBK8370591.1 redoxin domain-containing protein [Saprospiraceae bacterium]MBK8854556.1 redoxin domain-containing protein [Saprospiraceae bacterium]MBK9044487.1 redoxin domain-containing protein [Saprospiraceae bacterium]MBP6695001.1 redoxin domain-containing protein [Saprospiraceae bacterium]